MELDGLVGVGGEGRARGHDGDAAADVAGERLDIFERGEFDLFYRGGVGELLEVEFGVAGDDGEEVSGVAGAAGLAVEEQSLEDLFGREADLARDGDGGEVVGIDLIRAEFVGDAEGVEQTCGVGLDAALLPSLDRHHRGVGVLRQWRRPA